MANKKAVDQNNCDVESLLKEIDEGVLKDEEQIKEFLLRIGALYSSIHENDYDIEFADLFESLNSARASVLKYQEKRRELLGLILCEKCGGETSVDNQFCVNCGARLKEDDEPAQNDENDGCIVCTACGTEINSSYKFCHYCGKSVAEILSEIAAKGAELYREAENEKSLCAKCGAELSDSMRFCVNCGTPVSRTELVETVRICPSCGVEMKKAENAFCTECGYKF